MGESNRTEQKKTVQNISESVYEDMCLKIGTPQQVAFRRDMEDIAEMLTNIGMLKNRRSLRMLSGSEREGFRLSGSDKDVMFWLNHNRVIMNFSQVQFYNVKDFVMILCDSSESPPGFTLLWLPLKRVCCKAKSVIVSINGISSDCINKCISSSRYREVTSALITSASKPHGPCSSGTFIGAIEYDHAHCFVSDFWPPAASSWKDRCHSWPPPNVVNDIIRNGCHFVPIGHKSGNHTDNEWRISFSRAEYKLVCSMNHTQFLTYGLLKLFLTKIINKELRDEDKLLCSYHMKTAVFWAIQQNPLPRWCPQNILDNFWVCFKLLLKWVYEGDCPNFFIPENNMFHSKIHGAAQKTLFAQLYRLYEMGIPLMLRQITDDLCKPGLKISTDKQILFSEVEFDIDVFMEICAGDSVVTPNLRLCKIYLHRIEQLLGLPLTQYHIVMLQKLTATILQRTAFILHNMYTNTGSNKQLYITNKISCHMLKLTAKFGCASDMLYIAMYYKETFRYSEALSVIDIIKVKLAQPYIMYRRLVERDRYTNAVGGQSLSKKMRQAVAMNIKLYHGIFYINELILEQQSSKQNGWPALYIPPHVLLYMLEFLCSKHIDTMRAQRALHDLQDLVHCDQRRLLPKYTMFGDISWEILGICQELSGSLQVAMDSYIMSLCQKTYHRIQTATRRRIFDLIIKNERFS
nr:uncharacterized protein LOC105346813 [Crassostrea gigas]